MPHFGLASELVFLQYKDADWQRTASTDNGSPGEQWSTETTQESTPYPAQEGPLWVCLDQPRVDTMNLYVSHPILKAHVVEAARSIVLVHVPRVLWSSQVLDKMSVGVLIGNRNGDFLLDNGLDHVDLFLSNVSPRILLDPLPGVLRHSLSELGIGRHLYNRTCDLLYRARIDQDAFFGMVQNL